MTTHKMLLGLTLIAAFLAVGWTRVKDSTRYTFTAESTMHVEGTSSLHAWKADVKALTGSMEITGGGLLAGGTLSRGNLTVAVSDLDCDNGTMNKKMLEALKASAHKAITFDVVSARLAGTPSGNAFQLVTQGHLTLAGVKKPVEITLNGQQLENGALRLKGSYALLMSDFNIKPPTAMMGALKTGNEVTIHFDLVAVEAPAI